MIRNEQAYNLQDFHASPNFLRRIRTLTSQATYDAVVVGSGAAGGMAAHVLTSQGLKVLLLEAGKYQDTSKILHSMEWPYDHPRRGKMPPDYHALTAERIHVPQSPVRAELALQESARRTCRAGADRTTARPSLWMKRRIRTPARTMPGCARAS